MILFSFDIEEFDMPFEYNKTISFEDQIAISREGTHRILDLLDKYNLKATFFCTVVFAKHVPDILARIKAAGHELASHTYYHSQFEVEHLRRSREELAALSGMEIQGLRMPRMMPVYTADVKAAGYSYNSSINPTWLPGRYNNLHVSRTAFVEHGLLNIPASVSPGMRIPLFWLLFHNVPMPVYRYLLKRTYRRDGYLNLYFHPWEFHDLRNKERFNFPGYVARNSGEAMYRRMDALMRWVAKQGYPSGRFSDFIAARNSA